MKIATINWYKKDVESVYSYFNNEESNKDKLDFLLHLMANFPRLEIDWFDLYSSATEKISPLQQFPFLLKFREWYKLHSPEGYELDRKFMDRDLCSVYLFQQDRDKLLPIIENIKEYPDEGIDVVTNRLLYQLLYHKHDELALDFTEAVWKPIDESNDLIGYAAFPYIHVIYLARLQKRYEAFLNGAAFDEKALFQKVVSLGFSDDRDYFNLVMQQLSQDPNQFRLEDEDDMEKQYMKLHIHCLKYLYHTYQIPFALSDIFWEFIPKTDKHGKMKPVNKWAYCTLNELDRHTSEHIDFLTQTNDLKLFGQLWGSWFIYDFFHSIGILSEEKLKEMQENLAYVQFHYMKIMNDRLWQMDFVFKWPRTTLLPETFINKNVFRQFYSLDLDAATQKMDELTADIRFSDRVNHEISEELKNKTNEIPFFSGGLPYVNEHPEPGRNAPCPCGSGKKYKKCCLKK